MSAQGGLLVILVWVIAVGLSIAAFVVIRLNDGEVEQPLGDWPQLHPEMVAASETVLSGGVRAEQARRRNKRTNAQGMSLNHSGDATYT